MRLSGAEKAAFAMFAQEVFELDTAIQWFVLEKAGREPCCARRDIKTGRVFTAVTTTELVDPLVLMPAEGRDGLAEGRNHHRLLFVVLAFADLVQIVARFGRYDHVGVAVDRHADAYTLGRKLTELLDRRANRNLSGVHADGSVPA